MTSTVIPHLFIMMTLPLALAIGLRRRFAAPWWLFCVGMLTFVAAQALHLPLNKLLTDWGAIPAGSDETAAVVALGAAAGLHRRLVRDAGLRGGLRVAVPPRAGGAGRMGVMLGLGHGGIRSRLGLWPRSRRPVSARCGAAGHG